MDRLQDQPADDEVKQSYPPEVPSLQTSVASEIRFSLLRMRFRR